MLTFDGFVTERTRGLIGLATAMSGDAHLAEDIVQDVLLKAHQRWDRIAGLDDPLSYVRRMVANEYLSWRRKWARVVPFAEVDVTDDRPDEAARHADRVDVAQQLAALTRRQRTVLALRFYGGLSDSEIAGTLGCGVGSVRTHASRGLAALRTAAKEMETS